MGYIVKFSLKNNKRILSIDSKTNYISPEWFQLQNVKIFPTKMKAKVASKQAINRIGLRKSSYNLEIVELTNELKEEMTFLSLTSR